MIKAIPTAPTWLRMLTIVLSIGGGFAGFATTLQLMLTRSSAAELLMCGAFTLLHTYLLISGLLLVHNPYRLAPVAVAFLLQIPVISSPMLSYRFGSGAFAMAGIGQGGFSWFFRLGVEWQFTLMKRMPWLVGVNFVALIMLVILTVYIKRQESARAAAS